MFLARWFDRGLGQIVAPDETHSYQPPEEEARGILWQIVAPDPKFSTAAEDNDPSSSHRARVPPSSAFLSPPPGSRDVQCIYCQQWTPVRPAVGTAGTTPDEPFLTPEGGSGGGVNVEELTENVEKLVLSAAKETAAGMTSPPQVIEARTKVFRICANPHPLNDKLLLRLRQLFTNDPSLIHLRSSNSTAALPDGFTPLMAAAFCNQLDAVKLILELSPKKAHSDRDTQGRTALHIAAERGHVQVARVLREHEGFKSPPRTDLNGRTPLGRALTSAFAAKNQAELEEMLFSPDDASIRGVRTPAKTRAHHHRELELVAGHADMPGIRITMEDALLCFESWTSQNDQQPWALFAVCDGHGDYGQASHFIVDHVVDILRDNMVPQDDTNTNDWTNIWTKTCLQLDASYQQTRMSGGSTGVFALVSPKSIIVANVGDSRCILVQRGKVTQPTGEEPSTETPALQDESTAPFHEYVVTLLSQDHKPDLPDEKQRVENAGMAVFAETFKDHNGQEQTIYKVARSDNDRLSMSRSFGDYEYKNNATLGPEEQAVVAVPEVKVHNRTGESDAYLVLACDGIWDVMTNEDVANFVVEQVDKELEQTDSNGSCLAQVADRLLEECLARKSRDNMSVIIVALSSAAEKVSAGQVVRGKALDFA